MIFDSAKHQNECFAGFLQNKESENNMKKINILFLVLILAAVKSTAGESVTLQECIRKGLEQNFRIRIVRNEEKIADNNFTPGNAGYLPVVSLNSSLGGSENDVVQIPSDGGDRISNKGVSNLALSAGVDLNWTVFDGFNIQADYAKLKELQKIGQLQTKLKIETYISDLAAEYYNYVQQKIRYKNLRSAVKLSKERLRIVEARYNIGNLSRLDLQQARVDFNTDSSSLIRQNEVLHVTRVKINQLMSGPDVDKGFRTRDTLITFNALLDQELLWNDVAAKNTYLQIAAKEKDIKVLELKAARSSNYPYLRVNAGYGYDDNKYEYATYKRQNSLGFNYGVTLGYNLFDGFNRSRTQKNAKIQIENKKLETQELELSLKSDFSNLWMAYVNNMKLASLEQENLQHAVENYEIAIERYKLGDLSGIELREAQNSLLEAEERLVEARYQTKLCEISLLEISGNIERLLI